MSTFQTVFLIVLILCIVGAVAIFALVRSSSTSSQNVEVAIWGLVDNNTFQTFLQRIASETGQVSKIRYAQKSESTFDQDFLEALASGTGPDIILLPQNRIVRHQDKIFPIPYANYSERQFKDTFVEEGELYLGRDGIIGLPFSIDPLVMYWNRDLFGSASIAAPPTLWSELFTLAPKITKKDASGTISKSLIGLGEFRNITHAKEILSILIMQAGNQIMVRDRESDKLSSVLGDNSISSSLSPAESALRFYTEFSNPIKTVYSWNRSLPSSKEFFLAGDSALYVGFASEFSEIREKNSNLNFDVALLPQSDRAENKTTFADMHALALVKNSKNITSAFPALSLLTSRDILSLWSSVTNLPPVRRDMLQTPPSDATSPVFYTSAIRARGWLDPNEGETTSIFQKMLETSISGEQGLSGAVGRASQELQALIQ